MRTLLVLAALSMLSGSGCATRRILADPNTVHKLAADADVEIWVRAADGKTLVKQPAIAREGMYLVPQHIVEEPK